MFANPFSSEELHRRLSAVRQELVARRIEAAVFASPENVFYLTGLDHWGYFAPHLLIVPLDKQPALVTRAMERVSIAKQVAVAEFHGHADSETAADVAARVLAGYGLAGKRLGLEFWASGLNHGLASSLRTNSKRTGSMCPAWSTACGWSRAPMSKHSCARQRGSAELPWRQH